MARGAVLFVLLTLAMCAPLETQEETGEGPLTVLASLRLEVRRLFEEQRFHEAIEVAREEISLREAFQGAAHAEVGRSVNNLALLLAQTGDHAAAIPQYERALGVLQAALGRDHADVATLLLNFGESLRLEARFDEAASQLRQAVAIRERSATSTPAEVARVLDSLALVHDAVGDYASAAPLMERALELRRSAFGENHPEVAVSLGNLAATHHERGDLAAARPLYERSLSILVKHLGPAHHKVVVASSNLALLLFKQGETAAARVAFEQLLALAERVLPASHPLQATILNNLGSVLRAEGELAPARARYERALALREEQLPAGHPDLAESFNNLAALLLQLGEADRAVPLLERSLLAMEEGLGSRHARTAVAASNLAYALVSRGDLDAALRLFDRSVSIVEETPVFPSRRIAALTGRARTRNALGEVQSALRDLDAAIADVERLRVRVGGSEETRASFGGRHASTFEMMVRWQIERGNLSEAFRYLEMGRGRALLDQLAVAGIDLTATIPEPEGSELRGRVRELSRRLVSLASRLESVVADGEDASVIRERLRSAEHEYGQVQGKIKNSSRAWRRLAAEEPPTLTWAQRLHVPPGGHVLLYEIGAEASHLLWIPESGEEPEAWELTVEEATAATLGIEAGALTVGRLAEAIGQGPRSGLLRDLSTRGSRAVGGSVGSSSRLHALFELLVGEELWRRLTAATEVVIVPDEGLHLLPFEALVVSDAPRTRYWLDDGPPLRYTPSITVLDNLTDRMPRASEELTHVLSVSDANYGQALTALPGTAEESQAITAVFADRPAAVTVLQGATATEKSVRMALAGSDVVHLATHGIVDERRGSLFASLALTVPGDPHPEDDGYLQLHEIYELPLDGAELAVLSACDSNVGREVRGEGVFSLSRGFMAAGVGRVVASLWAVDDASTAALIGRFFERIAEMEAGDGAVDYAVALSDARRRVRDDPRWADPFYWAPFILTGIR